jgi:hypothetical protein
MKINNRINFFKKLAQQAALPLTAAPQLFLTKLGNG